MRSTIELFWTKNQTIINVLNYLLTARGLLVVIIVHGSAPYLLYNRVQVQKLTLIEPISNWLIFSLASWSLSMSDSLIYLRSRVGIHLHYVCIVKKTWTWGLLKCSGLWYIIHGNKMVCFHKYKQMDIFQINIALGYYH